MELITLAQPRYIEGVLWSGKQREKEYDWTENSTRNVQQRRLIKCSLPWRNSLINCFLFMNNNDDDDNVSTCKCAWFFSSMHHLKLLLYLLFLAQPMINAETFKFINSLGQSAKGACRWNPLWRRILFSIIFIIVVVKYANWNEKLLFLKYREIVFVSHNNNKALFNHQTVIEWLWMYANFSIWWFFAHSHTVHILCLR